ncbi:MAG: serine protease Do [Mariniblastus sp.]|jgi:serine protease Do
MRRDLKNYARILASLLLIPLLALAGTATLHAHDHDALRRLKEIQHKITSVVSENRPSCVAVTDGLGFGSGVIVSEEGLVLTAGHVMASSDRGQYQIILPSGKRVQAKALGKNLNTDTGMLKIVEPGPWPFVKINQTENFQSGQWVVSLGHSGGWELGRNAPVRTGRILAQQQHHLLTDAVLIGGDSGGPLFDLDGTLIGIHSSIGDSVAENRHVTMSSFERDWERLLRGDSWGELPKLNSNEERAKRGLIGVRVDKTANRCLIKSVAPDSAADELGIAAGDIVTSFDQIEIINGQHLIDVIKRRRSGDRCPIIIERLGRLRKYQILLR